MRLPHPEQAVIPLEKLRDYCLNPVHPRGRHKARVFASVLGLDACHAEWLRQKLAEAAFSDQFMNLGLNEFGERFLLRFELEAPHGRAMIRSLWLVKNNEDFPRLSSCYVE